MLRSILPSQRWRRVLWGLAALLCAAGLVGEILLTTTPRLNYRNTVLTPLEEARKAQREERWQDAVNAYRDVIEAIDQHGFVAQGRMSRRAFEAIKTNMALNAEHRTREAYAEYVQKERALQEQKRRSYEPTSAEDLLAIADQNTVIVREALEWENSDLRVTVLRSGANNLIYPLWALQLTQEESLLESTYAEAAGLSIAAVEAADTLSVDVVDPHRADIPDTTSEEWMRSLQIATRLTMEFLVRPPREGSGEGQGQPNTADGSGRRAPVGSEPWGTGDGEPQTGFGNLYVPAEDGEEGEGLSPDLLPLPGAGTGPKRRGH